MRGWGPPERCSNNNVRCLARARVIAVSANSRNKSPGASRKRFSTRGAADNGRQHARQMFSTLSDGIPENTFAGFLGPAEATATVARAATGSVAVRIDTCAKTSLCVSPLGGRSCRDGGARRPAIFGAYPRRICRKKIAPYRFRIAARR